MQSKSRIGLGLAALWVSGQAFGQAAPPDGYQVNWGALGVPLSPWLNVLIVLMLALATYVFLRRRAGRGVMLVAGALCVGGLSLYAEKNAISIIAPTTLIATPSGSVTLTCDQTHWLGTSVPEGVTLRVTPIYPVPKGGAAAATPSGMMVPECASGTHLNPGDLCYLCSVDA
jgi:hypothetical protein